MGINFLEIYTKAISLFDDPKITRAYEVSKVQFCKLMYGYLQNAISLFSNPAYIGFLLASYSAPQGQMEVFDADGENNSFTLDPSFVFIEGSIYQFMECSNHVKGTLDIETRTITFPDVMPLGETYSFEQYFPGDFTQDFSGLTSDGYSPQYVANQIQGILARLLVICWAEEERNFLLDIRNIMSDDDFKISSNANSLRAKIAWLNTLNSEIDSMQNKLAWVIRFARNSQWGRHN